MRVLASPSSTFRARYRHIEDGFPRSISSSRPVDISTSINPYRARFPELDLFIEAGWHIELDKLVSSSVAQKTKLIRNVYAFTLEPQEQMILLLINFYISFITFYIYYSITIVNFITWQFSLYCKEWNKRCLFVCLCGCCHVSWFQAPFIRLSSKLPGI